MGLVAYLARDAMFGRKYLDCESHFPGLHISFGFKMAWCQILMVTQILTFWSLRGQIHCPDLKIITTVLHFSAFFDKICRFNVFPRTVIFLFYNEDWTAILRSEVALFKDGYKGKCPNTGR